MLDIASISQLFYVQFLAFALLLAVSTFIFIILSLCIAYA